MFGNSIDFFFSGGSSCLAPLCCAGFFFMLFCSLLLGFLAFSLLQMVQSAKPFSLNLLTFKTFRLIVHEINKTNPFSS